MAISERLEALIRLIEPGRIVADIGTDHAYLPIALVQRGLSPQALACDVKKGPLERARAHIEEAGLAEKIGTRLSDGLAKVEPADAESAVLAGMGGMLICDILLAESKRPKNILKSLQQMVLQPQSDIAQVRRTVHALSWKIETEALLNDRGKWYWILSCKPGREEYLAEWQYSYGAYLSKVKDPVFYEYIKMLELDKKKLLEQITGSTQSAESRREVLQNELNEIEEVKRWWNSQPV